jgi:POT family proton-dependent oligopeptide transporter
MNYFVAILLGFIAVGLANALWQMRKHPKGLYILFFAEMWERFSYYGMRALLIFYLTKHFLFTDDQAYGIYGAYTTLVYITPVIGGLIADRYLGQRKAILVGAILLVLGHLGMAIEGAPVTDPAFRDATVLNIFYLSLSLIIAGTGFLKGNISAIVGELYGKTDIRRDSAFTLFYVGINLGAAGGSLIAGFVGETYGWSYGFGLAGIGMLAGLVVFVWGKPLLRGAGEPPKPAYLSEKVGGVLTREWMIYVLSFVGIGVIWFLIRDETTVGITLLIAMVTVYAYILYRAVATLETHARNRILAALFLISVQVLFWALFEQAGSSLNLFTDRAVDTTILGQEQKASIFQSLNAIYIVFLGPIFALGWAFLAKRNLDPSTGAKFGLGVIQLGLGFLVLVWGANAAGLGNMTPVFFIFMVYLLHTTGELCLSPVGLSAMTRLSTPKMVGLIMGAWFLASGAGNFVAAQIAKLTSSEEKLAGLSDEAALAETQRIVLDVYSTIGWVAVGVGVVLILISPLIKRMMHLDTLGEDMIRYNEKHGLTDNPTLDR